MERTEKIEGKQTLNLKHSWVAYDQVKCALQNTRQLVHIFVWMIHRVGGWKHNRR